MDESLELAYTAGQEFRRTSNSLLPEEALKDPVGACPFPEGDEQRTSWLQGYADAHQQEDQAVDAIQAALDQEEAPR